MAVAQCQIMGIVNVTPDSFSDGGRFYQSADAIAHGLKLWQQGADYLDIGGESTRPGALKVPAAEQWRRIKPVIGPLLASGVKLSVDTTEPEVMQRALDAGVHMVNDTEALSAEGAVAVLAAYPEAVIGLMHKQGSSQSMQQAPHYHDVLAEVEHYLKQRVAACLAAGIKSQRLWLDPGFGFGKSAQHNLELARGLERLRQLGYPLLVGLSRKSVLPLWVGQALEPQQRLSPSLAAALWAFEHGAAMLRVHDVAETVFALRLWGHLKNAE